MANRKDAQAIIANRRKVAVNDATGEVTPIPVGEQSGVAPEAPPPSTPPVQPSPQPSAESGGEAASTEAGGGADEPRIPKHRLDKLIKQRNEARDTSTSKDEEIAGMRKELVELREKDRLSNLKLGKDVPSNFDQMSEMDRAIWLHEHAGSTKPTEEPKPQVDPDIAMMKAERSLMLEGYSMEEAVILNDIMSRSPDLTGDEVMVLAQSRAPDLFVGGTDEGGSVSHPSHTTIPPRSTKTARITDQDPMPALKKQAREGSAKERRKARQDMIKLARSRQIREPA